MEEQRLQELFTLVTEGDEQAATEVFEQLRPRLTAIAITRGVPTGHDVEDVVQEALMAMFNQLRQGKFENRSAPSTWVIGILLKKIADHFRRHVRHDRAIASTGHDHQDVFAISRQARPEVRVEVIRALARLTPRERFVLTGTELAGLTQEEVAVRLKCPTGTVASTKNRAVAKFKQFFRGPDRRELKGDPDGDV